mmetsp:Transcript_131220/g.213611  ORF Transcript_131220/g.213611 Transcript_131220/m.213611 type:complete len:586 (-) Transcript_131220:28-1785(-)
MTTCRLWNVCKHSIAVPLRCGKELGQRFPREEEAEYLGSLEHLFFCPVVAGAAATALLCSMASYSAYSKLMAHTEDVDMFELVMVLSRVLCTISAVLMLLACLAKRTRCLRVRLEGLFLAFAAFLEVNICWFNAWHGCVLFGKDPQLVWPEWTPEAAEGSALLSMSTIVCVTCLIVPVRSHLSWIVLANGLASYTGVTLICGSGAPAYLMSNLLSVAVLMMCTLYGSYKNEVHFRQEWCAHKKVVTQQNLLEDQYDGVCRILNLLCDCTVRLGPDLKFLEPNSRFAAMLMKRDGGSLMGRCIDDHIPNASDRERFGRLITGKKSLEDASSQPTTSISGMFHINFKDSMGTDFPVDIYHTCITNKEGSIEYLLGIVESSVREPGPARVNQHLDHVAPLESTIIESVAASLTDSSDSSASSRDIFESASNLEEVAVNFLAGSADGFPMLTCTPGFTHVLGPITDREDLLKFIMDDTRIKFARCVGDMCNVFYNSCQNVVLENVVFSKPGSWIDYRMDAISVDFVGISFPEDDSGNGCDIVVRAAFHGIHKKAVSNRRHKKRAKAGRVVGTVSCGSEGEVRSREATTF